MATGNLKISQLDLTTIGGSDLAVVARGTGNYRVNLSGAVTGVLASWAGSSAITTIGTLAAGAIPESLLTFTDISNGNASSSAHGLLPRLPNNASYFLNGTGGYSVPPGLTGVIPVASGGTNITSYASGDLLYASSSTVLSKLAAGTSGYVLTMGSAYPTWAASVGSTGGAGTWGSIAGTLSNQTDLQTQLNLKQAKLTLTGVGSLTTLSANYEYTGVLSSRSFTLPTGVAQDYIIFRGQTTSGVNVTWPTGRVRQVGSTDYASGTTFTSGNTEFSLAYDGYDWYLADSSNSLSGLYQPLDATLTAFAGTTFAADKLLYSTGVDAFTTLDFPLAGRNLVSSSDAAAQRAVMNAAALDSANAFTATNSFVYSPSITRTQLSPSLATGNSTLNIGEFKYDVIQSGRTLTFGGSPVEGSQIGLRLFVTGAPILTIPTSKRFGETGDITSLGLYPGSHKFVWERVGSEWMLSDTVGIYNKLDATSAPTVNDGTLSGYSINSRWINTITDITYDCTDNTSGAALWRENVHALPAQIIYNKTLGTGTKYALGSDATGDIWYRGTDGLTSRLGIGSAGQVLTVAGGLPSWAASAGGLTGVVPVASGGTNITSYTTGDLLYASADTTLSKLGIGTSGYVLTSNGISPTWAASVGGSGAPGGSGGQLQYNNGGSFGGVAGSSVNGGILTLSGLLVTGSAGLPALYGTDGTTRLNVGYTGINAGPTSLATGETLLGSGTLSVPGTYLLMGRSYLKYNGATFAANQTATLKLKRTNNTPADIPNALTVATTRIISGITDTMGILPIPPVLYSTTSTGDIVGLYGYLSSAPAAGSVDASETNVLGIRLFE